MSHGYPRSPNLSTKFSDSSSVSSAASPRLLALGSRFLNGQPHTGSLYSPESSHQNQSSTQYEYQQHQNYPYHPSPDSMAGESIGGGGARGTSLPPSDSLSSALHSHSHGHNSSHHHGHAHTPGPAYTSLPPLHHGPGSVPGLAPAHHHQKQQHQSQSHLQQHQLPHLPYTHQSPSSSQPSQHNIQKRAYRQRRKDPSCDACRERKVKCDATETASCSECSNRQVKCQFTKETNRRMSSIKQMQDLERQLDKMKRENAVLKRVLNERGCDPQSQGKHGQQQQFGQQGQPVPYPGRDVNMTDADSNRQSIDQSSIDTELNQHRHREHSQQHRLPLRPIPAIGSNPRRRRDSMSTGRTAQQPPGPMTPLLDIGHTRSHLRMFAKGVWDPPHHHRRPLESPKSEQPAIKLTDLPPRDVADTLLHAYYASIHTMLPMIHWPTFQRQVDSLYDVKREDDEPQTQPPASFVALFFAMLAVGGQFCTFFVAVPPSSSSSGPKPTLSAFSLADSARSLLDPWSLGTGSGHNLDDVRTLLLLSIFLNESNCRSAAWTWLAVAVRAAQSMDLYRDPDSGVSSKTFSPIEAEIRRRVWWAVYIMDRSLSLELGNRPSLIDEYDYDVSLPSEIDSDKDNESSAPLTQSMVAVLNVIRSYSSLSSLFSTASSYRPSSSTSTSTKYYHDRPHSSSSSMTTPSPSSSFATPSQSATSYFTSSIPPIAQPMSSKSVAASPITPFGTSIPATHLATFDQHFAACFHSFPTDCNSMSAHPLPACQLGPLVHLFNARLMLHRHNLSPTAYESSARQQQYPVYQHNLPNVQAAVAHARLTAIEQCAFTAIETAKVVRRVRPEELASGAGVTALLATHLTRCILFLLLCGHAEEALILVHALSRVAVVRREVAVPCGRWLASFISCLSFKRAEYTSYLTRATPPQTTSITVPSAALVSNQVYDALLRDEELLVYVSADMQASPDSSWVWQGTPDSAPIDSPTEFAANDLSNEESRMGLSAEESRDWGGWDSLENRVRSLAASGTSTPTHATAANVPPPTSYSTITTTTGTASPLTQQSHYTHQPYPSASSVAAFGGSGRASPTVEQEHPHYYHQPQPPPPPHPQSHLQAHQHQYQPYPPPYQQPPPFNPHESLAKTPSASEIAASAIAVASAAAAASAASAPSPATSRPLASSSATPRVDTGPGGAAGASAKSKSEERISIANII